MGKSAYQQKFPRIRKTPCKERVRWRIDDVGPESVRLQCFRTMGGMSSGPEALLVSSDFKIFWTIWWENTAETMEWEVYETVGGDLPVSSSSEFSENIGTRLVFSLATEPVSPKREDREE